MQASTNEICLLQFCPEPSPPCASPLLLHNPQKREAEEETEPSSPDSGLTESTSSTDDDNTDGKLFNGVGLYPPGLPYPPSTFAQSQPFPPYGQNPYFGLAGYPGFGGYSSISSLNPQPFLGSYRGHPFHRGPGGFHLRH